MKGVPFFDRRCKKVRPFLSKISGGSRPSNKGGLRGQGCGHPDPEIRGRPGRKKFQFQPFRPQFGLKIRGSSTENSIQK